MGTHMRVLSESYPMNTNNHDRDLMNFKNLCILVLWMKVAIAVKGLKKTTS